MEPMILLGEPIFKVDMDQPLNAPVSQFELCRQVRAEAQDPVLIHQRLRQEYLAIARALRVRMEIDFRVVCSRPNEYDKVAFRKLYNMGCRFVGFTPVSPALTLFPRDFGTELPGICLLNPDFGKLVSNVTKGRKTVASFYGEGGRVLARKDVVLIGDMICRGPNSEPPQTHVFKNTGLKVGILPNFIALFMEGVGPKVLQSTNDHLDRVACLLEDPVGKLHLVVDPLIHSRPAKKPTKPKATLRKIKAVCERLGIEVHTPKEMRIPYSLGLWQFKDGRVLMSSGDEPVAGVVKDIVGEDRVFLTEMPIRYYPAWTGAGIHCLIGEAPSVFFKPKE